ncbi:hypothetical protein [Bradyrhizobium sp. HKCCYLR1051]|uniref:hypothetical protein n=1 Tax=Bradyrhizobium sp. HKCCYLR1051 TaxID=3420738 RepID=UPI003EC01878
MTELADLIQVQLAFSRRWLSIDDLVKQIGMSRTSVGQTLRRMHQRGEVFRRRDCSGHGLSLRYAAAVGYDAVKDLMIGGGASSSRDQLIALARQLLAAIEAQENL